MKSRPEGRPRTRGSAPPKAVVASLVISPDTTLLELLRAVLNESETMYAWNRHQPIWNRLSSRPWNVSTSKKKAFGYGMSRLCCTMRKSCCTMRSVCACRIGLTASCSYDSVDPLGKLAEILGESFCRPVGHVNRKGSGPADYVERAAGGKFWTMRAPVAGDSCPLTNAA